MERIQTMVDAKAIFGTVMTAGTAQLTWLEIAQPVVTMTMTVLVGGVTLWYTVERAMKLRKERKDDSNKGNKESGDSNGSNGRSVGDR